jgi:hypothetical protein
MVLCVNFLKKEKKMRKLILIVPLLLLSNLLTAEKMAFQIKATPEVTSNDTALKACQEKKVCEGGTLLAAAYDPKENIYACTCEIPKVQQWVQTKESTIAEALKKGDSICGVGGKSLGQARINKDTNLVEAYCEVSGAKKRGFWSGVTHVVCAVHPHDYGC